MQVHSGEGPAHHSGPEPCGGLREGTDEKSVGVHVGEVLRRESCLVQSADACGRVEGNIGGRASASALRALRGLRAPACVDTPCVGTGRSHGWLPLSGTVRVGKREPRSR